jgi:hypothetical protein
MGFANLTTYNQVFEGNYVSQVRFEISVAVSVTSHGFINDQNTGSCVL